jgi:hypothetical protein
MTSQVNSDGSVTTTDANGCYRTRSGGSSTWRNNNPGNLNSPQPGEIGKDGNGKSIFPDAKAGDDALHAAISDALRLSNASVTNKLYNMGNANGWPNVAPLVDSISSTGVNPESKWNGTYIKGAVDGDGGAGTLQQIPTEEAQRIIREAIANFHGFGTSGEESELICPDDSGSAD